MTKTTTETFQRVPLAKLKLAPENARFGSKDLGDIQGLAGSITAVGDLLDPLHVYSEGEAFMVWDGGRRLAALNKLAKLPPSMAEGVPVMVGSKAKAQLRSRATFVREALDPAEEFATYKALLDAKHTPEMIAAACAVPTPRVRQLLRLCGVAAEILAAFAEHKLPLDVVEAFSVSLDHKKQLAVWKAHSGKKAPPDAWTIKRALHEGAVGANDIVAVFVGRDVYEKAGGTFLQDLFTGRDDESWANGDLARRLYDEKINAEIAKHEAEGWAWVKFVDRNDYYYNNRLVQLPKPANNKWSDEDKAASGVFLKMTYDGKLDVQKGWTSPAKKNAAAGLPAAEKKPAQADPARYGFGHKGHHMLTLVATEATRVGLMRKPETAYDAMLSHLSWTVFAHNYGDDTASQLRWAGRHGPLGGHVEGGKELDALFGAWKQRLAPSVKAGRVAFCEFVAALKPKEKAELLAVAYGATLDAVEEKIDYRKPARWAHLGWIAAKAGVEPAKAWRPDADFLNGGSKDALLDGIREAGGELAGGYTATMKKSELAAGLRGAVKETTWAPKLLATFTDVIPKPKAAPDPEEPSEALKKLAGVYPED